MLVAAAAATTRPLTLHVSRARIFALFLCPFPRWRCISLHARALPTQSTLRMPFHERAPTHSNCTLRVDCSCSRRRLLLTAPQSPPLPYLTKKRRNTLDNTVYFVNYVACIRNHDYFFKVMFNALTSHTHTQTAIWR